MIGTVVAAAIWAVAASLIFSLVLGAAVGIAIHFVQPAASTRQALWSVASGAAGFAPVLILAVMLLRATVAGPALPAHGQPSAARGSTASSASVDPAFAPAPAKATALGAERMVSVRLAMPDPPHVAPLVARIIVAVWVLGALGGLIGLGRSLVRVRGLKLRSSPLDGDLATDLPWLTTTPGREIYLRLSYETETPIAIGFRRPVILIPTEMATAAGLTSIEPLVMHEYAHLARYDDWTNLAQRAIERIFWFNPLVWIIGRRIVLEREVAADEAVVARTHDAKDYASALWRMAQEMRMPEHVVVAPGAMLTRKQISVRIERLLEDAPIGGRRFGAAALTAALVALTGVAAVAATAPAISLAQPTADLSLAALPDTPTTPPAVASAKLHVHPHIRVGLSAPIAVAVASAAPAVLAQSAPSAPPAVPAPPAAEPSDPGDAAAWSTYGKQMAAGVLRQVADGQRQAADALRQAADTKRQLAQAHTSDIGGDHTSGPLTRELIAGCMGCDFSSRDLRGINLSNITLNGDDFTGAKLDGANFANSTLRGCDFTRAVLIRANLHKANMTGVDFTRADLTNADLSNASLVGVDLSHATMDGANTSGMHMIGSSLP